MRTVPYLHLVTAQPTPGEPELVAFARDIAGHVTAYAGESYRPAAVICLCSPGQDEKDRTRWTIIHLAYADGSAATLAKLPHPLIVTQDMWSVLVNGEPVELDDAGTPLRERLGGAVAVGIRRAPAPPRPGWTAS